MGQIKSSRETDLGAVVVVDSSMMRPDALRQNPDMPCPAEILRDLRLFTARYYGFDGRIHEGQIVMNGWLEEDITAFFDLALEIQFPIEKLQPAVLHGWDDEKLMTANISSGFNFRYIVDTQDVSMHGLGLAFDINPRQNPYIRFIEGKEIVVPEGALHDRSIQGTLYANHPLVELMKQRGWEWGGDWTPESGRVDYQHFQKLLS